MKLASNAPNVIALQPTTASSVLVRDTSSTTLRASA
jgi:hypothetical protein